MCLLFIEAFNAFANTCAQLGLWQRVLHAVEGLRKARRDQHDAVGGAISCFTSGVFGIVTDSDSVSRCRSIKGAPVQCRLVSMDPVLELVANVVQALEPIIPSL